MTRARDISKLLTGDLTLSGTIDGRDLATDGTKLDGIEANADVTDSTNVANSLNGLTTETTFTSSDIIPVYDTATSTWKKGTITNAALQGPAGADGATGPAGADGADGADGTPSTTLNTVGSYMYVYYITTATVQPGSTVSAGTAFMYSNSIGTFNSSAARPSGTLRCMGYSTTSNSGTRTTLWCRTA